ncbi:MAG: Transketolase, N-terminal section [uncultured Chloroflexia bacterium]|uniref:Transketolase, N-terminal section n=1 Tax=uncultured Chloroflexia bacterium TaxID=1672391 RepID=A0A6J4LPC0_9CHLR|nr:MAG: Transketolase, N-terminal section [uncultured Chloroflexia bacterium]
MTRSLHGPISSPEQLRTLANTVRRRDIEVVHGAKLGHVGGEMSAIDILVTLYFGVLRVDPNRPDDPNRDRFILSKGHTAVALYTTLAHRGFLPLDQLATFAQPLSKLNGHPDRTKVPGVETNTGPLGHGLPVAVGAAIAAKLQAASWRVFALTGDGELQEGSNWEAAMSAAHYRLDNLTVIIDRNRLQQGDWTEQTLQLEPLADKWRAFGWAVAEVDGHDIAQLLETFSSLPFEPGKPNCIIAHTHKGQGVSFMQDKAAWHHKIPSDEELNIALAELGEVVS